MTADRDNDACHKTKMKQHICENMESESTHIESELYVGWLYASF
jgi:hypothetical protein